MTHRAVIIQSNYIPWKGYFDLLASADSVVFLDSVQSTKNDWRNRNQIKTQNGKTWLTIPVRHSNSLRIRDVEVSTPGWHRKHLRTLSQAYARAPFARTMIPRLSDWYEEAGAMPRLAMINKFFIGKVLAALDASPRLIDVEDVMDDARHDALSPTERLVEICRGIGASLYLSGPSARNYMDESSFSRAGIELAWFHYDGYMEYPQLHGAFDHAVSIMDTLLMTGPNVRDAVIRNNSLTME